MSYALETKGTHVRLKRDPLGRDLETRMGNGVSGDDGASGDDSCRASLAVNNVVKVVRRYKVDVFPGDSDLDLHVLTRDLVAYSARRIVRTCQFE